MFDLEIICLGEIYQVWDENADVQFESLDRNDCVNFIDNQTPEEDKNVV